jgi:hypothetical protein
MSSFEVIWDEATTLLTTRIRSPMAVADVAAYRDTLGQTLATVPSGTTFTWLSSAVGYDAMADRTAHLELRSVVPLALAAHGVRTSLLDMHQGAEIAVTQTRGIVCRAIAHVHHDAAKMDAYNEHLARSNERYFGDEGSALAWLKDR